MSNLPQAQCNSLISEWGLPLHLRTHEKFPSMELVLHEAGHALFEEVEFGPDLYTRLSKKVGYGPKAVCSEEYALAFTKRAMNYMGVGRHFGGKDYLSDRVNQDRISVWVKDHEVYSAAKKFCNNYLGYIK
tara:strand:+ start:3629 stop:4021 length:393 start_codon:yes stop_codon:yes gene_type:complete